MSIGKKGSIVQCACQHLTQMVVYNTSNKASISYSTKDTTFKDFSIHTVNNHIQSTVVVIVVWACTVVVMLYSFFCDKKEHAPLLARANVFKSKKKTTTPMLTYKITMNNILCDVIRNLRLNAFEKDVDGVECRILINTNRNPTTRFQRFCCRRMNDEHFCFGICFSAYGTNQSILQRCAVFQVFLLGALAMLTLWYGGVVRIVETMADLQFAVVVSSVILIPPYVLRYVWRNTVPVDDGTFDDELLTRRLTECVITETDFGADVIELFTSTIPSKQQNNAVSAGLPGLHQQRTIGDLLLERLKKNNRSAADGGILRREASPDAARKKSKNKDKDKVKDKDKDKDNNGNDDDDSSDDTSDSDNKVVQNLSEPDTPGDATAGQEPGVTSGDPFVTPGAQPSGSSKDSKKDESKVSLQALSSTTAAATTAAAAAAAATSVKVKYTRTKYDSIDCGVNFAEIPNHQVLKIEFTEKPFKIELDKDVHEYNLCAKKIENRYAREMGLKEGMICVQVGDQYVHGLLGHFIERILYDEPLPVITGWVDATAVQWIFLLLLLLLLLPLV
ncbi:hypothetical protein RFI_19021 [Reticulomyxa filosa]|uniref:Uncharacterized protein n=1 Tax=Reticulomyxa filosa TaxID=46433 RepID=X6MW80_RETFI|nr:hypothetical protein RFI_19021 [Reticulomyxa filosa]|eukprot:ETO18258.1 hypothetical protein RFI_19021 [Reticulomyxa filosa]